MVLRVWESLDYICAERLTPSLLRTAKHLASFGSLVLTAEVESQLATISPATVQRLLRKNRARKARLPRTGPHRANQLTKGVPMGRIRLRHARSGTFRDRFGASWRRERRRRVWLYLAVDRCGHRLE